MDIPDFDAMAQACAPMVEVSTIRAIARTESAFNPNALSVNYPKRTAAKAGYPNGYAHLARQPHNRTEAIAWAKWLTQNGYTVSIGLVQVNSEHLPKFKLTIEQVFDPCVNLALGGVLLSQKYTVAVANHGHGQRALSEALSTYNSGSNVLGFENGYVQSVRGVSQRSNARNSSPSSPEREPQRSANPYSAPTQVAWNSQTSPADK
jgi:type IV secretion system protein VirB1